MQKQLIKVNVVIFWRVMGLLLFFGCVNWGVLMGQRAWEGVDVKQFPCMFILFVPAIISTTFTSLIISFCHEYIGNKFLIHYLYVLNVPIKLWCTRLMKLTLYVALLNYML